MTLKARFGGAVLTNLPVGDGGSLAEGEVRYQIFDDSVVVDEGRYQAADFRSQVELQQYKPYPDNSANTVLEQRTHMSGNACDPQERSTTPSSPRPTGQDTRSTPKRW